MRQLSGWVGLLLLFGLTLQTASINVKCTERAYVLGHAQRQIDDLEVVIASREARLRAHLRTEQLARAAVPLGLDDQELYTPSVPVGFTGPVALGAE